MLIGFVSMEVDMRNRNRPQDGAITCQKLGVSLPDLTLRNGVLRNFQLSRITSCSLRLVASIQISLTTSVMQ